MIGVFVNFDFEGELDRERIIGVAEKARSAFEGMPELRSLPSTRTTTGRRTSTSGNPKRPQPAFSRTS
jgi:hypothetical protein